MPKLKKVVKKRPPRDNARQVSQASAGKLNIDQVRILRTLKKTSPEREMDKQHLRTGCGIMWKGGEGGPWLASVWDLDERKLITIRVWDDGPQTKFYAITAAGRKLLESVEARAKSGGKVVKAATVVKPRKPKAGKSKVAKPQIAEDTVSAVA